MNMKIQSPQRSESDEAMEVQSNDNEETESDYKTVIWDMITTSSNNPLVLSSFAIGGEIENSIGIPAMLVEGVGRVAYPLCKEQTVTLLSVSKQAYPRPEVLSSVDGTCRAWEIDGHSVHVNQEWLSDSLPILVSQVCTKLGIDVPLNNVVANLDKLLLLEEGGHFKKHRDTENRPGMFGSLLIQLPAEHEGGHLTVEHDQQKRRYQFDKKSADKSYYSAFYADCEYTLESLTKGRRLLLVFNLICSDAALALPVPSSQNIDEILAAATRDWLDDEAGVRKLAISLAHKYKHTNMTFAGLKKQDRQTLELLQSACDPATNEKLFSVHLALVTMHSTQPEKPDKYGEDLEKLSFTTDGWVGPAGPVDFGSLAVDFSTEIISAVEGEESDSDESEDSYGICRPHLNRHENIFGDRPDREQIDDDRELSWHYSAVLVIWPAQWDFSIKLSSDLPNAVSLLQRMNQETELFVDEVKCLLAYLSSGGSGTWEPARVLPLTQNVDQTQTVLKLCRKKKLTEADAVAVVQQSLKFGWTVLAESFKKVFKSQSPAVTTLLLDHLRRHSALVEPNAILAPEVWSELVELLLTRIEKASPAATVAPDVPRMSNFYSAYRTGIAPAAPAPPVAPAEQISCTDQEWVTVSRFVATYCSEQDQERVCAHLGSTLTLHTLNRIIEQLPRIASNLVDSPLLAKLKESAVQQCIDKAQPGEDVAATVSWVVQGGFTDLLTVMQQTLLRLSSDVKLYRALFTFPVVLEALSQDSALANILESLMEARFTALKPHTVTPPFSWRMPANLIVCSDPRVSSFLMSNQEIMTLGGFSKLDRARDWALKYCWYGSPAAKAVSARASGAGQRAIVTLTKNKSVHEGEVQRCAENAAELQSLRQLLTSRGRDVDGADRVTSATTIDKLISIEASERQREEELPVSKRARVEPEIIVIDDD